MKNALLLTALIAILATNACKKIENEPQGETCNLVKNDTLYLVYPCDGQTNVIPNRFAWQVGPTGQKLEGFWELHVSKKLQPGEKGGGIYGGAGWSSYDRALNELNTSDFALLAFTEYEWYMVLRHDGNGLHYKTPVQTFTTGETGYRLPEVFKTFAGVYTVQDTFYEKAVEYITQYEFRYVERAPAAKGTKKLIIREIPGEIITTGNFKDTVTYMEVDMEGFGSQRVSMNTKGSFFWGDGNYYTPTSLSGQIKGKHIRAVRRRSGYNNPTYTANVYTGVKQ